MKVPAGTSAHSKQISTVQVAILSYWPGWGKGAGTTMNETVKKIKALNPNTKVFLYQKPESQHMPAQAGFGEVYNKITNERWWLTTSGVGGGYRVAYVLGEKKRTPVVILVRTPGVKRRPGRPRKNPA